MTSEEFKIQVLPWSRKLYPMVYRLLKNEAETEDAIQELMMKLWDKRTELHRVDNLDGYILTMAKNHCLDTIKKKKPVFMSEEQQRRLTNLPDNRQDIEMQERYDLVHQAILSIPEKYREVLQYRDIDGLEFTQIGKFTGYEEPYIRVMLSRARQMVKAEVQKVYSYEKGTGTRFC